MGKKKRAAPAPKKKIKLNEQKSAAGPSVDPYRQTSTTGSFSMSFEASQPEQEKSQEANEKLKSLISEIQSLGSRTDIEAPMDTTTATNIANSSQVVEGSNSQASEPDGGITFWKQLQDPNTKHAYFWNPKTNEVSWTLPNNAVIADDSEVENEEEADNPYAEYYKYYSEHYGKKEEATDAEETEENKEPESNKEAVDNTAKPPVSVEPEPTTPSSFVGPVLPTTHVKSHDTQVRSGDKRKAESAAETPNDTRVVKKPRLKGLPASPVTRSPQTPQSAQAEQAMRFQVSNLADELTRKLDYLHVTNEGLSDIQILNIQLQTRLADWKEGGLSSKFMLSKLKASAVGLSEYEQLAAPPGWKIVWESSSCRYRYHNLSTGEETWHYPTQISDAEASGQEESADDTAPESPVPLPQAASKRVIGPQLPSRIQPPSAPPPAEPEPIILEITSQPAEADDMETEPPESPPKEKQFTPYKSFKERNKETQPIPPPPPKSKLTVEKLREKLYPSLRPKRSRTSTDELEEQPAPEKPPTPTKAEEPPVIVKEVPPVIYKPGEDRMEYISEFPLDSKAREAAKEESKKKKNDQEIHVRVDVIPERFPNAQIVTMDKSMVSSIMSKRVPMPRAKKIAPMTIKTASSKQTATGGKTVASTAPQALPTAEKVSSEPQAPKTMNIQQTPTGDKQEATPIVKQAPPPVVAEKTESGAPDATPTVQQAPPTVQQAPPTVQQAPPTVQQAPPTVQQAPPTVQQAPPTVQQAPPAVQQAPPTDNEAELRERLLERQKSRLNSSTDQQSKPSESVVNDGVFASSQVDPETGAVEPKPSSIADSNTKEALDKTDNLSENDSKSTPANSESSAPEPKPALDLKEADKAKPIPPDSKDSEPASTEPQAPVVSEDKKAESKAPQDTGSQDQSDSSSSSESDSEDKSTQDKEPAATQDRQDDRAKRYERSRTSNRRSDRYSSRRHSDSDHDRYSDDGGRRRKRHSRRDHSSDDSHDDRYSTRKHRSDRSRHDNSDDEHGRKRSSRSSRRSSRKHRSPRRHHRSRSKDSHSPHKPKKSPKHKKVKKEKKKKHHKPEKVEKPEQEEESPKTPVNVIVGKVGMISSKRTLGQDKKEDESPKTPPVAQATMSATYYQQPSTGQVPYYNMDSYYQGYYNTGAYQQWGQGQWPSTSQAGTVQPATGAIQYPSASQYAQYSYNQYPTSSSAEYPSAQYPAATSTSTQSATATSDQNTASSDTTQTANNTVESNAVEAPSVTVDTVQTSPSTGATTAQVSESQAPTDGPEAVEETATAQEPSPVVVQDSSADIEPSQPKEPSIPEVEQKSAEPEAMEVTPDVIVRSEELQVVHSETVSYTQASTTVEQTDQPVEVEVVSHTTVPSAETQTMATDVVEAEEEITECDMEIEENTPSPKPAEEMIEDTSTQQASITASQTSTEQVDMAPTPAEDDSKAKEVPVATESKDTSVPEVSAAEIAVSVPATSQPTADQTASVIPTITSPTTATASAASTTAEVNSTAATDYATAYALAAQQQQAYNYAFQTNNYVQAAYNAYVQQTAAAYQAYGGYYPGYNYSAGGFTTSASPYSAGFSYGSVDTPTTTSSGRDYGKIAYELAQAKQNAADNSETKKSEFAIAGSKSKQMKSLMVKWSSFKEDDKSS